MENRQIKSFRDLIVWQQAMALVKLIYLLTKSLPKEETYGLTSQMRRAAVSVPANIAEGSGRGSRRDYQQFLRIAQGSLRELETYLLLLPDINLATPVQTQPILSHLESVSKLLRRLIDSLEA
jgi:four helix bundle protein